MDTDTGFLNVDTDMAGHMAKLINIFILNHYV